MNTDEIMQLALDMSGFSEVPGDSGIWHPGRNIRRILLGIDVGAAELKIAKDLGYDLVIAHHPVERSGFWKVYLRHVEFLRGVGMSQDAAYDVIRDRVEAMQLQAHVTNNDHLPSVARLLDLPFMNVHVPLDEIGRRTVQDRVDAYLRREPDATVEDVANELERTEPFNRAATRIEVMYGERSARAGRVVAAMAAATNGGYPVASALFRHGVDTVLYMHIAYEDLKRLRESGLRGNLVIIGHIAGDSIGVDAFVGALRDRGLTVDTFSGIETSVGARA
jgi:putative NIF3 family GTP cyclohydrolase 1 type 2